jgi:A/G-specific adenine glycosylase
VAAIPAARRDAIRRRLLAWWDAGHRDLPWRFPQHGADPYRVWLAEVMLQQTQVQAAIPFFERFARRFPDIASLAAAGEDEVLALWSGLGYYARARNLLAAAREAVLRHGGLPASVEALLALPGFGSYTAGAVASIAFAIPAAAIDGNVARVLARVFLVTGDPGSRTVLARLRAIADSFVVPSRPGDWNQALMELGATVCGKPAPRCTACPIAGLCAARRAGRERDIPPARRRPERRSLQVACAIIERKGRILLARRPRGGLFGGMWSFPCATLEEAARPAAALASTLREGLGLRVVVADELGLVRRILTHRELELVAYRCRLRSAPPRMGSGLRWAARAQLGTLALPTAMRALAEALDWNEARRRRSPRRPHRAPAPGDVLQARGIRIDLTG